MLLKGKDNDYQTFGLLERLNWWKWFAAGSVPEFVSKQKASPLTSIRNIQTLQISCQLYQPSERDENGGRRQGGWRSKERINSRRE